tara:strand:- start:2462 stop:2854 length:393 start_codon:yes stop_codon:yes gene_type:complete
MESYIMSRSEPNDGKAAISTTIEKINKLKCNEVAPFCSGKFDTDVIKPSDIVDDLDVKSLLYGIIQIKTRADTETRLRDIISSCYEGEPLNTGDLMIDLIGSYTNSIEQSLDKDATDEKWKTAIIETFRE